MSQRMSRRAWLVVMGTIVLGAAGLAPAAEDLEDGIYRISRAGTRRVEVLPVFENERLLIYDYRYFPKTEADARPQQLIVVGLVPEARLALSERPRSSAGDPGVGALELRLAAPEAARLEEFAAAHPGSGLALVVDGEVVTTERIREPLGGRFEVKGCRREACEFLEEQLRDNVTRSADTSHAGE